MVTYGVVIGFAPSSAAELVFCQSPAALYSYTRLFRLFPDEFGGEAAQLWARRFLRRPVIAVPEEQVS